MRWLLCICVLLALAAPAAADVAVIVNKSVPLDTITSSHLLDLYTGDIRTWTNGEPVVLIDLKPKTDAKNMFYDYLGKSSSRMKSIWMKNMLSGEGNPPQSFGSEADLLRKVASTPGAIGYLSLPAAKLAGSDIITLLVIPTEPEGSE